MGPARDRWLQRLHVARRRRAIFEIGASGGVEYGGDFEPAAFERERCTESPRERCAASCRERCAASGVERCAR